MQVELSDSRALLDLAREGDPEAFCDLCRMHETRLVRQAMLLCRNATLAEELAQDTLIEAWKSLRRYNGRCQFFTWLCAILLNRYRNTLRARPPAPVSSLGTRDQETFHNHIDNLVDRECSPADALQQREETARMLECLQMLPPKHLQVIYLRFYVDQSLEGIAAALGCPLGTVKSRLFAALETLRGMSNFKSKSEAPKYL